MRINHVSLEHGEVLQVDLPGGCSVTMRAGVDRDPFPPDRDVVTVEILRHAALPKLPEVWVDGKLVGPEKSLHKEKIKRTKRGGT